MKTQIYLEEGLFEKLLPEVENAFKANGFDGEKNRRQFDDHLTKRL